MLEVLARSTSLPEPAAPDSVVMPDNHVEPDPIENLTLKQLQDTVDLLVAKYEDPAFAFEIRKIGGGFQFFTKQDLYPFIQKANQTKQKKRLSRAALETLSIIGYRQPITKAEVEFIRGVNCDYAIHKLLEKRLIDMAGRADAPGRPMQYITSPQFLSYFGINDLADLPKLTEYESAEDQMEIFRQGMAAPSDIPYEQTEEAQNGSVLAEPGPEEEIREGSESPGHAQEEERPSDETEA